jgi:hypothetical protein
MSAARSAMEPKRVLMIVPTKPNLAQHIDTLIETLVERFPPYETLTQTGKLDHLKLKYRRRLRSSFTATRRSTCQEGTQRRADHCSADLDQSAIAYEVKTNLIT